MKMHGPVVGMSPLFDQIQPLSVEGEERAKALMAISELRGADLAVSSPMARTISTIRYILEADKIPYQLDERLRELEFGGMPAIPPAEHQSKLDDKSGPNPRDNFLARQWEDQDLAQEDGESIRQCRERMTESITQIVRENTGKKILVSSHGAAISSYLSGVIPGVDDSFVRRVNQPDVFKLVFEGDQVKSWVHLDLPFSLPEHGKHA